ncbi:MAG: AmmeMemoRadiSam system protein B [Terriglobia bacterium]
MHRAPAVAGRFYPAHPRTLARDLDAYIVTGVPREHALGCVVPHAGIMYSGHVAGAVYGRLEPAPTYILLCPNHTGRGRPLAIMSAGEWETPLGSVPIDESVAAALKGACGSLEEDAEAHRFEHSLEVQLPFLQHRQKDFRFVPIAVGTSAYAQLDELGRALAAVIESAAVRPLLVASSDLNHYEPDEVNRAKDRKAIDRILALDPHGLYETVHRERITMCGYGPATAMLTAVCALGAREAELIRYATSGDVTGDRSAVVGYAGILVR